MCFSFRIDGSSERARSSKFDQPKDLCGYRKGEVWKIWGEEMKRSVWCNLGFHQSF